MRYLVQLALTLLSAIIITHCWLVTGYRGPANLLAMLLPSIMIACIANEDHRRRAFMALALTAVHLVTLSILGVLVIGY